MLSPESTFTTCVANMKNTDLSVSQRKRAVYLLRRLYRAEALDELISMVQDKQSAVRLEVIKALRVINDARILPALLPCLADKSAKIRLEVVEMLALWRDP